MTSIQKWGTKKNSILTRKGLKLNYCSIITVDASFAIVVKKFFFQPYLKLNKMSQSLFRIGKLKLLSNIFRF
jgi:hypothetical protein